VPLSPLAFAIRAGDALQDGICGAAKNAKDGAPSQDLRGLPDGPLLDIDRYGVPRLRSG
jgi:hypothetical protein